MLAVRNLRCNVYLRSIREDVTTFASLEPVVFRGQRKGPVEGISSLVATPHVPRSVLVLPRAMLRNDYHRSTP